MAKRVPYGNKARFEQELQHWIEHDLISDAQGRRLLAYYPDDQPDQTPFYLQAGFIISALGIFVVALGLILLISQNWDSFPIYVRSGMGLLPLGVCWGLVVYYLHREKPYYAELAAFASWLVFGINVQLQAQIFHLNGYYPDGMLLWLVGGVFWMFRFRTVLMLITGLVLTLIWVLTLWFELDFQYLTLLIVPVMLLWWLRPVIPISLSRFGDTSGERLSPVASIFGLSLLLSFWLYLETAGLMPYNTEEILKNWIPMSIAGAEVIFLIHRWTYGDRAHWVERATLGHIGFLHLLLYLLTFTDIHARNSYFPLLAMVVFVPAFVLNARARQEYPLMQEFWVYRLSLLGLLLAGHLLHFGPWELVSSFYQVSAWLYTFIVIGCGVAMIMLGARLRNKSAFISGGWLIAIMAVTRFIYYFQDYTISAIVLIAIGFGLMALNRFWQEHIQSANTAAQAKVDREDRPLPDDNDSTTPSSR
jgi:uncharacterized membrane protein